MAATGETNLIFLLTPMVGALITRYIYKRNVKDLGWKLMMTEAHPRWWQWKNSRYLTLGYALPLLIGGVVFGITWMIVSGSYSTDDSASEVLVGFAIAATGGVLFNVVLFIAEEVGWRGFLFPELTKLTNFPIAAVITGLIWASWHYPLIFFAPDVFDFGELPLGFAVPMFTIVLIAVSVVLGWLRLKTGSIWPGVVAHGSHNSFTLNFFNDRTSETGDAPYIAGEVGILLFAVWAILAMVFWRIYSKSQRVLETDSNS